MAAKSDARLYEPSRRAGHYNFSVGNSVYVCFGATGDYSNDAIRELSRQLEVYNCPLKTWAQKKTTGTPPPGLGDGACVSVNEKLYTYGGHSLLNSPYTGTLSQLDTSTLEWKILTSLDIAPMKKYGARMVAVNEDTLGLFGGVGIRTSPTQPEATFVVDSNETNRSGWTNEFHMFNISNGTWSSPLMTGSRPPPCSGFSFTTVDGNRAVVFGGEQPGRGEYVSDVYIIDFNNMYWTKIEPRVGESWPVGRRFHAACCLGHGGEHPQLLISGGLDNDDQVLKDCWMFDLASRKWKKLTLPDDVQPTRCFHSITASTLGPGLVEVIMFGGMDDLKNKTVISATTILTFKFTREWDLVGIVNNEQRAVEVETAAENQRHYEAYQQALQTGVNVAIKYLKLLLIGPPRTGKTSLRRRLIGEIINLLGLAIQPSTGTVDAHNVVVKLTEEKMTSLPATIYETKWRAFGHDAEKTDLDEELHLLYQFITEGSVGLTSTVSDETRLSTASESLRDVQEITHSRKRKRQLPSQLRIHGKKKKKKSSQETHNATVTTSQEALTTNATVTEEQSMMVSHHTEQPNPEMKEIERALEAFNTTLKSRAGRQQLKVLLEKTILLNMVDTGGQPAFIEMLPMLTIGPALYLIFLRLDQELKQRYKIKYVGEDNEEVSLGESSYTFQEVIFQVLSSIACFRSDTSSTTSVPEKPQITSQQSQAAMLVGTYKDKLEGSPEEVQSKINLIDRALEEELKEILDTDLFEADRNLLRYASKDQLMFDVDNMTGGEDEVKKIRKRLEEVILNEFNEVPIPGSWLMFGLFLRRMSKRTISLTNCEEIGRRLHVNDVREAIWFLHHCIGVLMYYPDVEELKDVVLCDPQIVFDSVTELILNTFKFGPVGKAACDKFKKAGQFRFIDIKNLSKTLKSGILPLPQLVKLLEYLYIIARVSGLEENGTASTEAPQSTSVADVGDEYVVYFMPAVLPSAEESELNVSHSPVDPAPLLIRFKSGIVPVGLFCASIASLVARKKLGWTLMDPTQFEYILYKDCVTFRVSISSRDYDVTLISKPKQYEVYITRPSTSAGKPFHDICQHVLETVCHTLDDVISKIRYKGSIFSPSVLWDKRESPYELGFRCPLHPEARNEHVAVFRPLNGQPSQTAYKLLLDYSENKPQAQTWLLCLHEKLSVNLKQLLESSTVGECQAVCFYKKCCIWMGPNYYVEPSEEELFMKMLKEEWKIPEKDVPILKENCITRKEVFDRLTVENLKELKLSLGGRITLERHLSNVAPCGPDDTASSSLSVTERDCVTICGYLYKMDRPKIELLGGVLGLDLFKLQHMQTLPKDMVLAWLRKEDNVAKELTWNVLIEALRRPVIGQNGIADQIFKDKCSGTQKQEEK